MPRSPSLVVLVVGIASWASLVTAEVNVTGFEPTGVAPTTTAITVHFDQPIDPSTVMPLDSFWAFGRWSGTVSGSFSFSNGNQTVTLTPDQPFSAGESVMVLLSQGITTVLDVPLRQGGFSFQFWTEAKSQTLSFEQSEVLDTAPGPSSRAYGGVATDLDGDRYLDLSIVNEDTNDLRVFMNLGDGTGDYADAFLEPTPGFAGTPSPSEPHDFNRDGIADICAANTTGSSVSVLLGNGDGTFVEHQVIPVGAKPRGIAVLDADGDGDVDIATANADGDDMSLLLNTRSGTFTFFNSIEGGGTDEWGLGAADMNNDGLLDLVVGTRASQQIHVHLAGGDTTYALTSTQTAGGLVWMLALGDLNNDGNVDVSSANSFSDNGAILLGDGAGGLGTPTNYTTDPFPIATDLGDLDGDGDLDWLVSSFSGDWYQFENPGNGMFTFGQIFNAPIAASCALALDIDNDGGLDLALIDELADVVILMRNGTTTGLGNAHPTPVAHLARSRPNPLRRSTGGTTILYELSQGSDVRLAIYDVSGRLVRVLVDGAGTPGRHRLTWLGRNSRGEPVAAGVYFYRLDTPEFTRTRKLTVVQ